jgi:hypothetical protein
MENINSEALPSFDPMARFASLAEADAYLASHGKADAFAAIADQGEYILIARKAKAEAPAQAPAKAPAKGKGKPKPEAKGKAPKKAEAPKAEAPKAKGKQSAEKRIAAQGDLKAKPKPEAKDYGNSWRKLDGRKWIGPWAEKAEAAAKGKMPDAGAAKLEIAKLEKGKPWNEAMAAPFNGAFSADTHWPFRKRIAALAALIRARDLAGLKKHDVSEISTTPIMLGKLRDLAIAALSAKAEKQKGNGKDKAEAPAQAEAPQG